MNVVRNWDTGPKGKAASARTRSGARGRCRLELARGAVPAARSRANGAGPVSCSILGLPRPVPRLLAPPSAQSIECTQDRLSKPRRPCPSLNRRVRHSWIAALVPHPYCANRSQGERLCEGRVRKENEDGDDEYRPRDRAPHACLLPLDQLAWTGGSIVVLLRPSGSLHPISHTDVYSWSAAALGFRLLPQESGMRGPQLFFMVQQRRPAHLFSMLISIGIFKSIGCCRLRNHALYWNHFPHRSQH